MEICRNVRQMLHVLKWHACKKICKVHVTKKSMQSRLRWDALGLDERRVKGGVPIVSQLNDDQYDPAAQTFMTCETVGCVGDSARVT